MLSEQQPRLESPRLGFNWCCNDEPRAPRPLSFWSPLSQLRSLRQLVINLLGLYVPYTTFRFVCSLPLTHLGFGRLELIAPTAELKEEEEATLPPVTDTWQWLRLRMEDDSQTSRL